ncbi:hypothetical protein KBK19_18295 [Microvirga sp. STR05]|uniref:CcmD family protein n=1 Tax=Hymenobacter duratus TaxID=2771356 RepID=A0ABR8JNP0_9BACT|nr:hypothetical protein [Hymenobacter duratus]MBD2717002.1 hypothetical protein [Hymenobacter duratus]MBR7951918.1 hypothetical protein [Microvirga sp. STR05]
MKQRTLLLLLLLGTSTARAEKFDNLGSTLEHLALLVLLLVGGTVVAGCVGIYWLFARNQRKKREARQREQTFYESL